MAEVRWNNAEFGQLPSVAVAAHELKSPLALIRQLSLLLEEGLLDAAETRRIVRQLSNISDQSLALVQDLAQTAHLSPTLSTGVVPANGHGIKPYVALVRSINRLAEKTVSKAFGGGK